MSENKQSLRQADNKVKLEGLLVEIDAKEDSTADGREYLRANLTIETGENEQHQVSCFQMKLKKSDNTENGIYKSLKTVVDEYKTVQDVGREEADKVRITQGRLEINDYVGQDGQLRSFPQISTAFINRVEDEYNPHAEFEVEMVVNSVVEEIDKEDDSETGRAVLKGFVPLYGGKVAPFEFKVAKDGAGYVLDNYEKGQTVFVYGDIVNHTEKTVTTIPSAFGADKEEVKYNNTREYVVLGGTEPYEEDNAKVFDVELIGKALSEREVYLEGLVEKSKDKSKSKGGRKTGFDTTEKAKREVSVEKDDLPF